MLTSFCSNQPCPCNEPTEVNELFIAAVRRDVADGYPKPVDLEAATKSVTECSCRLFIYLGQSIFGYLR